MRGPSTLRRAAAGRAGLGVLIGARTRCLVANSSVALAGAKPALQRLLAVTGIDNLFPEPTAA
jgi:anti-anti-sigma regulatory factor